MDLSSCRWALAAAVLLGSCAQAATPEPPPPIHDEGRIAVRELDVEGRVRIKRVKDEVFKSMETRVFRIRYIQPPEVRRGVPESKQVEDWELYAVLDALLTRDVNNRRMGRMDYDWVSGSFVVTETHPVLDRMEELLWILDTDERRTQDPPRARGHLNLGRVPELLRRAHEALLPSLKSVEKGAQREMLRQPLLDLKQELDRIHKAPAVSQ